MSRQLQGSSAFLIREMASPLLLAFVFLVILETPATAPTATAAAANFIIDELYSREELVKMAGYGEDKISTVQIEGKVLCQTCSDGDERSSLDRHPTYPISGASVGILCSTSERRRPSWAKSSTDQHGGFLIDLPSHLHAIPNLEKTCLVKVLDLPKGSICSQGFRSNHKGIQLIAVQEGTRSYTTHTIHLTPKSCNHKQEMVNVF